LHFKGVFMNYEFNVSDNWAAKVTIMLDKNEFEANYKSTLSRFSRDVKMDGFRKGKVPSGMIEKRFKDDVEADTIEKMIPMQLAEVLKEKNISPISRPVINKVDKQDDVIKCEIEFDIFPDVKVSGYDRIPYSAKNKTIDDDVIEKNINALRNLYAELKEKDGDSAKGDVCIADIKVIDESGAEIEDLNYSDYAIELGDEGVLPIFSEKLTGKKKGDLVEFKYEYPADYSDELLKGKKVSFEITVKDLKSKLLPELNDAFAKKIGLETVQQLKDITKERLEKDFNKDFELHKEEDIINNLIEKNPFEPPMSLVEMHLESILEMIKKNEKEEITDDIREIYKNYAAWRAKREVILMAIAKQENLAVSDEDIEKEMEKLRKHPNPKVREYADKDATKDNIEKELLFDMTKNFVDSKSVYEEKTEGGK